MSADDKRRDDVIAAVEILVRAANNWGLHMARCTAGDRVVIDDPAWIAASGGEHCARAKLMALLGYGDVSDGEVGE